MSIIIRLQNLPWTANAEDIRQFFSNLTIPDGGVHIVGGEHGDAFIVFGSDEDARQAMMKDGGPIKDTKVKLLLSSRVEMQKVIETARQQALTSQNIMQTLAAASQLPLLPNMLSALPGLRLTGLSALPSGPMATMPAMSALSAVTSVPFSVPSVVAESKLEDANPTPTPVPKPSNVFNTNSDSRSKDDKLQSQSRSKSKSSSRSKSRSRSRSRDRKSYRDRYNKYSSKSRDSYRRRNRSRSKDRDKNNSRSRSRDRYRKRSRSRDKRNRDIDYNNYKSKDRKKDYDKNKSDNAKEKSPVKGEKTFQKKVEPESRFKPLPEAQPIDKSEKDNQDNPLLTNDSKALFKMSFVAFSKENLDQKQKLPNASKEVKPVDIKVEPKTLQPAETKKDTEQNMNWFTNMLSNPTMPSWMRPQTTETSVATANSYTPQITATAVADKNKTEMPPVMPFGIYPFGQGFPNPHGAMYPFGAFPPAANHVMPPAVPTGYPMAAMQTPMYNQFQPAQPMQHMQPTPSLPPVPLVPPAAPIIKNTELREKADVELRKNDSTETENDIDLYGRDRRRFKRYGSCSPDRTRNYENTRNYDNTNNSDYSKKFDSSKNFDMRNYENTRLYENNRHFDNTRNYDKKRSYDNSRNNENGSYERKDGNRPRTENAYESKSYGYNRNKYGDDDSRGSRNSQEDFSRKNATYQRNYDRDDDYDNRENRFRSSYEDNEKSSSYSNSFPDSTCVEVRNMPWDYNENDVKTFFSPIKVYESCIKFQPDCQINHTRNAFVKFGYVSQKIQALKYSGTLINDSRIQIVEMEAERWEKAENVVRIQLSEPYMKISFIPKRAQREDVVAAFQPAPEDVVIVKVKGRESLEAYLKFSDAQSVLDAFKNKHKILIADGRVKLEAVCEKDYLKVKNETTSEQEEHPHRDRTHKGPEYKEPICTESANNDPARTEPVEMKPTSAEAASVESEHARKIKTDYDPTSHYDDMPPPSKRSLTDYVDNDIEPEEEALLNAQGTIEEYEPQSKVIKSNCLLLKNLRYNVTDKEIVNFFSDLGVSPITIHIMYNAEGVQTGDSFCEFQTEIEAEIALQKDRSLFRGDVISVLIVSKEDVDKAVNIPEPPPPPSLSESRSMPSNKSESRSTPPLFNHRPVAPSLTNSDFNDRIRPPFGTRNPQSRGSFNRPPMIGRRAPVPAPGVDRFGRPGCVVSLENVPYKADVNDILDFFADFEVGRENVIRRFNDAGLATGDARVSLKTPDEAIRAVRELNSRRILDRPVYMKLVHFS